ncbi:class IV adenylate cyclase [Actinocorallia sp. API 0066]|uniref:class IV adenylate cyclase n=1 Tax=Actinocorallia sp. API 0066 TaxID=2896846 RepID=UPI001E57285D|nr:class IV adenylate cyclase [Actinocorallia sp. API 0066]MCD0453352.1 class IV adenylate cyclase [Actinocorallia sp. API 0066]
MKNTEVERKYAAPDPDGLRDQLKSLGAELIGTSRQTDRYFNHPSRDFLADDVVSEWLRLRHDDPGTGDPADVTHSFNFKQWLPLGDPNASHADEFETVIGDPDPITEALHRLGFADMVTVDKARERWQLADVEICVDAVEDLGSFVEFEYIGSGHLDDAHEKIADLIDAVGEQLLGARDRRGYPYLLLGREA